MLTNSEIVHYVQKRKEGWDNSQVRIELSEQGYSREDIFTLINEIDDAFILSVEKGQKLNLSNITVSYLTFIIGLICLILGIVLIFLSFPTPGLLDLIIGASLTTGGYFLYQNGAKNLKEINQLRKRKVVKTKDILDS